MNAPFRNGKGECLEASWEPSESVGLSPLPLTPERLFKKKSIARRDFGFMWCKGEGWTLEVQAKLARSLRTACGALGNFNL